MFFKLIFFVFPSLACFIPSLICFAFALLDNKKLVSRIEELDFFILLMRFLNLIIIEELFSIKSN